MTKRKVWSHLSSLLERRCCLIVGRYLLGSRGNVVSISRLPLSLSSKFVLSVLSGNESFGGLDTGVYFGCSFLLNSFFRLLVASPEGWEGSTNFSLS